MDLHKFTNANPNSLSNTEEEGVKRENHEARYGPKAASLLRPHNKKEQASRPKKHPAFKESQNSF